MSAIVDLRGAVMEAVVSYATFDHTRTGAGFLPIKAAATDVIADYLYGLEGEAENLEEYKDMLLSELQYRTDMAGRVADICMDADEDAVFKLLKDLRLEIESYMRGQRFHSLEEYIERGVYHIAMAYFRGLTAEIEKVLEIF